MGTEEAGALVQACLGRPAQDHLEAAVVLEAWGGQTGAQAFELAAAVVENLQGTSPVLRPTDTIVQPELGAAGEGRWMVFSLVAMAAWMVALDDSLGDAAVSRAARVALPSTLALQWLLMRRYLAGPGGMGRLRAGCRTAAALAVTAMGVTAASSGGARLLAAALVLIWVTGLALVRRGWGPVYLLGMGTGAAATGLGLPGELVATGVALFSAVALAAAVGSCSPSSKSPAAWRRALLAGLVGGGVGLLILFETRPGGHSGGVTSMLAVLPSLSAGNWAAHHLTRLWAVLPAALATMTVADREVRRLHRMVGRILLGTLGRVVATTALLSLAVLGGAGIAGHRAETLSVALVALGGIGLVGVIGLLLEAFGLGAWAAMATAAACAVAAVAPAGLEQPGRVLLVVAAAVSVAAWPAVRLLRGADFVLTRTAI